MSALTQGFINQRVSLKKETRNCPLSWDVPSMDGVIPKLLGKDLCKAGQFSETPWWMSSSSSLLNSSFLFTVVKLIVTPPVGAPISTLCSTYCPQMSSEGWPRMGKPSEHFKHHEFGAAHTQTHAVKLSESDVCVQERCFEVSLGGLEPRFEGAAGRLVLLRACFLKGPLRPSMAFGAVYPGLPTISHIKALKEVQDLDWVHWYTREKPHVLPPISHYWDNVHTSKFYLQWATVQAHHIM